MEEGAAQRPKPSIATGSSIDMDATCGLIKVLYLLKNEMF